MNTIASRYVHDNTANTKSLLFYVTVVRMIMLCLMHKEMSDDAVHQDSRVASFMLQSFC